MISESSTKRKMPQGEFCGKCSWLCPRHASKCSSWEVHIAPPEPPPPVLERPGPLWLREGAT